MSDSDIERAFADGRLKEADRVPTIRATKCCECEYFRIAPGETYCIRTNCFTARDTYTQNAKCGGLFRPRKTT
jgi:hypothetical protein